MGVGSIPPPTTLDSIPDYILQACFARLHFKYLGSVKAVCKRWQRLSDAGYLYLLRKSMGLTQRCAYMLSSKYEHGVYAGLQITGGDIDNAAPTASNNYSIDDGDLANPSVFAYDTVMNKWREAKPMLAARYAFAVGAFTCAGGLPRLLVAGGYDAQGRALASAELYDAASDEWESLPCMNALRGACKGQLTRGKFYVKMANNGPRAIEVFDPELRRWVCPFASAHGSSPGACNVEQECVFTNERLTFGTNPGAIFFDL